jgi:hypothetical protein
MLRRKLIAVLLMCSWACLLPAREPARKARPIVIELPGHILRFSVPSEMLPSKWPVKYVPRFDPQNSNIRDGGFYGVFELLHDFDGPFWVGAYGSLKIAVSIVHKCTAATDIDVSTPEGIENCVRAEEDSATYAVFRATLNGIPAVLRSQDSFGEPGPGVLKDTQVFSLPLDAESYLNISFFVREWEGGRAKAVRWKPKAEAMREAIKATVEMAPHSN